MIPRLRKQPEKKSCHGYNWIDDYSWVHQDNCLEILRDPSKVNPEVRKYIESENAYTKDKMADTEEIQKKIFKEIEGRIKLDDESLPYKDKKMYSHDQLLTLHQLFTNNVIAVYSENHPKERYTLCSIW